MQISTNEMSRYIVGSTEKTVYYLTSNHLTLKEISLYFYCKVFNQTLPVTHIFWMKNVFTVLDGDESVNDRVPAF